MDDIIFADCFHLSYYSSFVPKNISLPIHHIIHTPPFLQKFKAFHHASCLVRFRVNTSTFNLGSSQICWNGFMFGLLGTRAEKCWSTYMERSGLQHDLITRELVVVGMKGVSADHCNAGIKHLSLPPQSYLTNFIHGKLVESSSFQRLCLLIWSFHQIFEGTSHATSTV